MPAFLGLHFPASDIPPTARELYRLNPTRAIFDANDPGAPLHYDASHQADLDLTYATLRSVSPVHLQYLQNMDVGASMSASCLAEDGRLWGMICAHHSKPKVLSADDRFICHSIANTLMLKRANTVKIEFAAALSHVRTIESRFAHHLGQTNDIPAAFQACAPELLALFQAQGLAFSYHDTIFTSGTIPADSDLQALFAWLNTEDKSWFATDQLWQHYPAAKSQPETLCGLLTQRIDRGANCRLVWLRPSAPTAIQWAGNPYEKTLQSQDASAPLSPRHSFSQWCNENEFACLPWPEECQAIGKEIFQALFVVIESRASALAQLNTALTHSNEDLEQYAYAAAHDLKSPLRAIDNLALWLSEDLQDKMTQQDQENMAELRKRADRMENLLDGFLEYAKIKPNTPTTETLEWCSGSTLIEDIQLLIGTDHNGSISSDSNMKNAQIPRHPLQRTLLNLVTNAIKHNDKETPLIEITLTETANQWCIQISDNGPGIDKAYHEKIFQPYEKLESRDTVEGSGLGLAIARKAIAAEGGSLRLLNSTLGKGSCFEIVLPKPAADLSKTTLGSASA
jgi:light-regulated signal transduction histidine kinase (bacteriophytochrome)